MREPYLKFIRKLNGISVWEVDGKWIRDHLDADFTNFGQHYRFDYVPKDVFWIDRGSSAEEKEYFINHLIIEYNLMKSGMSYDKSFDKAQSAEKKERQKETGLKLHKKFTKEDYDVYVDKICIFNGLKIELVDGAQVRDRFLDSFIEGGHHYVYSFIPLDEIWIDNTVEYNERAITAYHELVERELMKKGMKYHKAHQIALSYEMKQRIKKDL